MLEDGGLIWWFLFSRYKPVDHKQIMLPLREAFEDLFSQTYSRKQNLTFLGHVQTCFRGKRWHDLLRLMEHVCKSALANELKKKPNGTEFKNKILKKSNAGEANAFLCVCSCLSEETMGGNGFQTESDSAADANLWDNHGVCFCGGKHTHLQTCAVIEDCSSELRVVYREL